MSPIRKELQTRSISDKASNLFVGKVLDNGKAEWITTTDNKYYMDENGLMITGKFLQISGKWYYFYADGKLATNTTVDGHDVGADGARKE